MIQKFIEIFMDSKELLRERFSSKSPEDYEDIMRAVIKLISDKGRDYAGPDPYRIISIGEGDCQGKLLFLIGSRDRYRDIFWYSEIEYGSCSTCDTFEKIHSESENLIDGYMMLALHIVQSIKVGSKMDLLFVRF